MTTDIEATTADAAPDCCAPGRAAFLAPSPAPTPSDAPSDDDRR